MIKWYFILTLGIGLLLIMGFLLLLVPVMLGMGGMQLTGACTSGDPAQEGGGSGVVQANATNSNSIPSNYLTYYQRVGKSQNIPWVVLAGIGKIETDHGRTRLRGVRRGEENYAGAGGPMQFLKSSWAAYGDDGSVPPDGVKDRYDPEDAILGAANHLRGSIGKSDPSISLSKADIRRAVHLYNPGNYTPQSNPYANDVLAAANRYARSYSKGSANFINASACTAGLTAASGPFGKRIAAAAAEWTVPEPGTPKTTRREAQRLGKKIPYVWGGGNGSGPTGGGFDCSGLASYAVHKASGGEISLPRVTTAQWNGNIGTKLSPNAALAPGDLVYFRGTRGPPPGHMGIFYGEVNGVRWMVEAPVPGSYVKFSKFDGKSSYMGAIRLKAPVEKIRAMAPAAPGIGRGAM
ncbi:NlpC/P60 family protein [Actinomadura sp. B10D3]|uniref:C40 family peptidase n=1 Tax=Actinomadura sp. B10D3 TaxID=3153557 RepID=UPI00325CBAEA